MCTLCRLIFIDLQNVGVISAAPVFCHRLIHDQCQELLVFKFIELIFLNLTFNEFLESHEVHNRFASFDLHRSACRKFRQLASSLPVLEAFCAGSHIDSFGCLVLQRTHMPLANAVRVPQFWLALCPASKTHC